MTLETLCHLMNIVLPHKNTTTENLHTFIKILSAEKGNSEALSQFIHRLHLLSFALSEPGKAEELLSAYLPKEDIPLPLPDFAEWSRVPNTASDEMQASEAVDYFHKMTAAANVLRTALIDAEREKGAPALYILDKLLNLNSALPDRYKKMANIPYA